ncbi:MAG: GNAT family N-acetyltransferase [Bacteroidetes bacterium]|nr:GNAT family N-acetyltransferase [Bacteroidota bacterium]MCK5764622.1 GNAT family N-acetyltransferase [Bacteroidales bacterium]
MIDIVTFNINEKPDLSKQANQIRQKVFVEEQNVDPVLEYDEYESTAIHYLLSVEGVPVATARWRETPKGIKLERFATLTSHRNKGLGAFLLEDILNDILPTDKKIYLHSQLKAIPFYKRHGFVIIGEQFTEADIEHFEMEYR